MGTDVVDNRNIINQMELMELFLDGYTTCHRLFDNDVEATFQVLEENWDEEKPQKSWAMNIVCKTPNGLKHLYHSGLTIEVSHEYNNLIRVFVNESNYRINFNKSNLLEEFQPKNITRNDTLSAIAGHRSFDFLVEEIMDAGRILNFVTKNLR